MLGLTRIVKLVDWMLMGIMIIKLNTVDNREVVEDVSDDGDRVNPSPVPRQARVKGALCA